MVKDTLKKLREDEGFSVLELAVASGVSPSIIYKLESGEEKNPTLLTLTKIATALNVSTHTLIASEQVEEGEAR